MKNMKNMYSDPDPLWNRIRIHFFQMWIRGSGSGSTITERWIRGSGSGSTFPKCGSEDPDPDLRQNEMDPKRCLKVLWLSAIGISIASQTWIFDLTI